MVLEAAAAVAGILLKLDSYKREAVAAALEAVGAAGYKMEVPVADVVVAGDTGHIAVAGVDTAVAAVGDRSIPVAAAAVVGYFAAAY